MNVLIDVNIQQQLGSVAKLNLFISSYAEDCETPLKGFWALKPAKSEST